MNILLEAFGWHACAHIFLLLSMCAVNGQSYEIALQAGRGAGGKGHTAATGSLHKLHAILQYQWPCQGWQLES
jgi:hypothetical protein